MPVQLHTISIRSPETVRVHEVSSAEARARLLRSVPLESRGADGEHEPSTMRGIVHNCAVVFHANPPETATEPVYLVHYKPL